MESFGVSNAIQRLIFLINLSMYTIRLWRWVIMISNDNMDSYIIKGRRMEYKSLEKPYK